MKKMVVVIVILVLAVIASLSYYNYTHVNGAIPAEKLGVKAAEKGDISLCRNLKQSFLDVTNNIETLKLTCAKEFAIRLKDPSACAIVPNNWDIYCYGDVARALNDQRICDSIAGSEHVTQKQCYGYFAQKNNDVSICNNVENAEWRAICIKDVQK